MTRAQRHLFIAVSIPTVPWAFFAFVYYPREVERHTHGTYVLTAFAEPSSILHPVLLFGSIHNNAQVRIELRKDDRKIKSVVVGAGDLPEDFLPLRVQWNEKSVSVTEPSYRRTTVIDYVSVN